MVVASALPRAGNDAAPVARGDVARGGGDVHQRLAHAPAEKQSAGQRDDEAADARKDERHAQLVEELLGRRPVLQQHEVPRLGRMVGEERECPADELAVADPPYL